MSTKSPVTSPSIASFPAPRNMPFKIPSIWPFAKHKLWSSNTCVYKWSEYANKLVQLPRLLANCGPKNGPNLYQKIASGNSDATITQLRTGQCRLNNYLCTVGRSNCTYCKSGHGYETVQPFLMPDCRRHRGLDKRSVLRRNAGDPRTTTSHLERKYYQIQNRIYRV